LGADWDYTDLAFVRRYNADLANDFGNLLNRTVSMVMRYFDGTVPQRSGKPEPEDCPLLELAERLGDDIQDAVQRVAPQSVLSHIWALVEEANRYVQASAPWELAKARKGGSETAGVRLGTVLYNLVDTLRLLGHAVWPVMPEKAEELLKQLGLTLDSKAGWAQLTAPGVYPAGAKLQPGAVLFPRLEE
jgi:methionyl-tRNA synthetase